MPTNTLLPGLTWLLLCQSIGEVLSRLGHLGLPGPVIGMLILLLLLRWEAVRTPVGAVADALLAHLSLLFVPVGVGVMSHVGLIAQYGLRLALVLLLSTWIGLLVTAVAFRALMPAQRAPTSNKETKMSDFVQLWVYLSTTPLFGLTATLLAYLCAQAAYRAVGQAPWANPVLWTVLVLAGLLTVSGTPYPTYFSGAQFIHFLLGPAVVALAWPLWQRRKEVAARARPLLLAALIGGFAASASAVAIGWALGLPDDLVRSLAPKSVTAPVAMGIAQQLGGIPALAAVFAVLTGLIGAISAKYLFDAVGGLSVQARGFAIGTAAHGIGAARAMQVNADSGAYAGLALSLQVVLSAVLIPLAARLFN